MSKSHNDASAKRHSIEAWLTNRNRNVWHIPIYQRHYSWDSDDDAGQVQLFWDTVVEHADRILSNDPKAPHYFGAVLVNEQRKPRPLNAPHFFDVVDGQQRLTTIQLAMLALIRASREREYAELAESVASQLHPYLYVDIEGQDTPILQPTNYDNDQYYTVLSAIERKKPNLQIVAADQNAFDKSKVIKAFDFFKDAHVKFIEKCATNGIAAEKAFASLHKAILDGFDIVLIQLRSTDRPQEVFQSLNTTSKPLTTLDLIRNDVFQRAADVRENYDHEVCDSPQWKIFEDPFWEDKVDPRLNTTHIETYLPRMLIAKLPGENVKLERNVLVKTYRDKFAPKNGKDIMAEVSEMVEYEAIYRKLVECDAEYMPPVIEHRGTAKSFGIFAFAAWGSRDFWPVVFLILKSAVHADEQQRILRLLESYIVRRHVSGQSTSHYNQFVVDVCAVLAKDTSYNSLEQLLLKSDSPSTGFSKSDTIIANLAEHNFVGQGNSKRISTYVLHVLARDMQSDADEMQLVDKLTIDHILPKSWHTDDDWQGQFLCDGEDHTSENARKVNNWVNTIGNLTLLSSKNNPRKSNRSFSKTQNLLKASPLKMNREIVDTYASENGEWNLQSIENRGKNLVDRIRRIWPHPLED